MPYTKPMDEIARELRSLIVQAKELARTAAQAAVLLFIILQPDWMLRASPENRPG